MITWLFLFLPELFHKLKFSDFLFWLSLKDRWRTMTKLWSVSYIHIHGATSKKSSWCAFGPFILSSPSLSLSFFSFLVIHLTFFLFFSCLFILLYNIVLILSYIDLNPPWVYICSQSWTPFPPPSPYHPSGSSQCTSPEHPVSCIEPGLVIHFTYNLHDSVPFSLSLSLSHRVQKTVQYVCVSFAISHTGLSLPSF